MITNATFPHGFKGYQARDLVGWSGDFSARKWVDLIAEISSRLSVSPKKDLGARAAPFRRRAQVPRQRPAHRPSPTAPR
jgi:hypothetical protein